MDYINYVKQAPLQGMTGLWGGVSSNLTSGASFTAGTISGDRGIFNGSTYSTPHWGNTIQYIDITSTSNASVFGNLNTTYPNLVVNRRSCSDGSRICMGGGVKSPNPGWTGQNPIDYVTSSTTGNAQDFGNLTQARQCNGSGSNGDRGIWGGGILELSDPYTSYKTIDYVTIQTTGNAQDFGDLSQGRSGGSGVGDGIYVCFGGGRERNQWGDYGRNTIDYVNVFTTGNATDFGNLTAQITNGPGGCDGETRGIYAGGTKSGDSFMDEMQYITIQTPSNSTDFGDLTQGRYNVGGCSNFTRGVFGGGSMQPSESNVIDYVTIATTGNASDFGDFYSWTQNPNGKMAEVSGASGSASDEKLKDNITPIEDSISKVSSISGNTFNWNEKSEFEGKLDTGVIAQEVEKLGLPGIVEDQESGYKKVHYYKLVPLLIESVKELSARVEILEQPILDK